MEKHQLLKQFFGHTDFRPGQEALIDALLSGRDVLGVMPTGAGKSVCYQLPALMLPGMTLVVSPLISLMKDQVTALNQSGIPAAFLNSTLSPEEYDRVFRAACAGQYRLLYAAPERLMTVDFLRLAAAVRIPLLAVDEAHCISHWGQDFRPSYLQIADFARQLPVRPVIGAFTATATDSVKADIVNRLELQNPLRITTGFDRPNLYFDVVHPEKKTDWLKRFLLERPGQSGIIYCATRKTVETVCDHLNRNGLPAARYHAGLSDDERRRSQEDFIYDRIRLMVATNAFGMGIDKSNVSFVVHYNMPRNLESYYQEAGRAGRDGERAVCTLLYSPGDVRTARFLLDSTTPNERLTEEERAFIRRQDLRRLEQMIAYCETPGCLRAKLLAYFGEEAPERCENCGNCRGEFVQQDITLEAQKILSGAARIEQQYPYGLGPTLLVQMLHGLSSPRVLQLHLDRLSTFGVMSDVRRARIRVYVDWLIRRGYLTLTDGEFPVLHLNPSAREVLFHGEKVIFPERRQAAKSSGSAGRKPAPGAALPETEADESLLETLKALRLKLARAEDLPAYIVFSNAALADMAVKRPHTPDEFLQVSGVGEVKAARYGEAFLNAIREWEEAGGSR